MRSSQVSSSTTTRQSIVQYDRAHSSPAYGYLCFFLSEKLYRRSSRGAENILIPAFPRHITICSPPETSLWSAFPFLLFCKGRVTTKSGKIKAMNKRDMLDGEASPWHVQLSHGPGSRRPSLEIRASASGQSHLSKKRRAPCFRLISTSSIQRHPFRPPRPSAHCLLHHK